MKRQVNGCGDCPFCYGYDMASGFGCKIENDNQRKADPKKQGRTIKESEDWHPITPEWCPIKDESITIYR
jgi:hypothetical protein